MTDHARAVLKCFEGVTDGDNPWSGFQRSPGRHTDVAWARFCRGLYRLVAQGLLGVQRTPEECWYWITDAGTAALAASAEVPA